eukprot:950062-Pyramimonas_sp.AAC.1
MGPRNHVRGYRNGLRGRLWIATLGPSRWSPLGGHETCESCAEAGGGDTCGHRHWGLRLGSL